MLTILLAFCLCGSLGINEFDLFGEGWKFGKPLLLGSSHFSNSTRDLLILSNMQIVSNGELSIPN